MSTPSLQQLHRAVAIQEQIEQLQQQLAAVLGGGSVAEVKGARKQKGKRGGKRKMSPEARERIAAAQRARWAKVKRKA